MFDFKKQSLLRIFSIPTVMVCSANSFAVNPSVSLPKSINLGVTSFYAGLSGEPGFTYQVYAKQEHSTGLKDNEGNAAAQFDKSDLDAYIFSNQFDYKFKPNESGGNFGLGAILSVIEFSSDVGSNSGFGPSLVSNDTELADLTLYSSYQFPLTIKDGVPIFSHRVAIDLMLPTGGYDETKDINQSINTTTLVPSWAFTLFLSERLEVSGTLSYMYNFENTSPSGSAPLDFNGAAVSKVQAGQSAWLNFATSYKLTPEFYLGINGYYLKQFTDDKVNGETFSGSKEQVFAIGPGGFWMTQDKKNSVWLNVYHESQVENRFANDYVAQLRYIHQF